jgi:ketosteroid isomerase-like protein
MKKLLFAALLVLSTAGIVLAQRPAADVNQVVNAEKDFDKLVERKGIKDGFLAVADPEGIVFKPNAVNITEFYNNIASQAGTLTWTPNFARIAANGDLAFTAGPYIYQNGTADTDKVFGDYVSLWRADADGNLKLLIDLGIQHPEPDSNPVSDFKNPDSTTRIKPSKDPFAGKKIILATDNAFNQSLKESTLAAYKEFLSPEGRYYFPGFESIIGQDKIMQFIDNEAISITAQTTNGGRSTSNDLAYTYGKAQIKKGTIVSNYNYVRIWEQDASHKWDILLEVFSAVENE